VVCLKPAALLADDAIIQDYKLNVVDKNISIIGIDDLFN
jgi:hypothetical protein